MVESQVQDNWLPLNELYSLKDKGCIVTGGAMGIGFAIARRMGEAGASILIADIDNKKAQEAVDKLSSYGYRATWAHCDVSKSAQVKNVMNTALSQLGSIDILVNNVSIYPRKPLVEISEVEWDRVLDINLKGTFLCSHEASRIMIERKRGGRIINIGSIESIHPCIGFAHYDASKGGLLMLTKNMASELAQHGIRVNIIAPGPVKTEGMDVWFLAGLSGAEKEKTVSYIESLIPLGRRGEPDEIATVAVFLASDASSFMTGSLVLVDGGRLLT